MSGKAWRCRDSNEFGLTDRQTEAVAALIRVGSDKLVAKELGVSSRAAATLLRQAQKSMGVQTRVHLALAWERRMRDVPVKRRVSSVFDLGAAHA